MLRAADQNVRCDPDGLQFFYAVLCWFGFQLTAGGQIGQQCEVHENTLAAGLIMGKLSDGFEKGQAFDVADCASNLAEHEINLIVTDFKKFFNFIRDMGDNLDGFAEIIAATLFFQHGGIDPTRGDRIGHAGGHAGEAFIMAQIQIGFCTVIGYKYFAMFEWGHRSRVDVQVGIKLAQPD